MWGYRTSDVARLLGLSVGQVRAYVRGGFLSARRESNGELRFNFQDLVLLRTARGLIASRVPARRVRSALRKLKAQLPEGHSLSNLHIRAHGEQVVVGDGHALWNAESGQAVFDFDVGELAQKAAPLVEKAMRASRRGDGTTAAEWFEWGADLEDSSAAQAREAYARAIELDPSHADARVNLGRLSHEAGALDEAERHYRAALAVRPDDGTAWFNLGVVLEDDARPREALAAYESALRCDRSLADAHYNAALLYERAGRKADALLHLGAYRRLVRSG